MTRSGDLAPFLVAACIAEKVIFPAVCFQPGGDVVESDPIGGIGRTSRRRRRLSHRRWATSPIPSGADPDWPCHARVWPFADSIVLASAASTPPLIERSSAPAASIGADPAILMRLAVPSAISASTLVRLPARRPCAEASMEGRPLPRNCGAENFASVTFHSPPGAVLGPVIRASASSFPSRVRLGSAIAAIDSGMARTRAVRSSWSPARPSTSMRPPSALMARPLISAAPAPRVIVAGPASERRLAPRCAERDARSMRVRSPGVTVAALAMAKPLALTARSSAVPAPEGRALSRAEGIVSLPNSHCPASRHPPESGGEASPGRKASRRSVQSTNLSRERRNPSCRSWRFARLMRRRARFPR